MFSEGDCDGITLETEVHNRVTDAALKYWPKNAAGDFDPTINSEIAGFDAIAVEMWDNHLHLFYLFSGSSVYAYTASQHQTTDPWWYWVAAARSAWCSIRNANGSCWKTTGYSHYYFHSNGFPHSWMPDVDAWTWAYGHAYGSGYYYCQAAITWGGATWFYPDLYTKTKYYLT